MAQLKEIADLLGSATREQDGASREIRRAVERMRQLGQDVKRSTQEQSKESGILAEAVETVSDRVQQISRAARQAAFRRDLEGGEMGLQPRDMDGAVSDAMERLSTTLTIRNAHAYLDDLPQDLDVVRVDPIRRKPRRAYRYVDAG